MRTDYICKEFIIEGLVQGIGYRPFVAQEANALGLFGYVRNTAGIVTVKVWGPLDSVEKLGNILKEKVPAGGLILKIYESVASTDELCELGLLTEEEIAVGVNNSQRFSIIESSEDTINEVSLPLIPADLATCPECERELFDPTNRRYMHPFISCISCGPRYSIIKKLPYDRVNTVMADFDLCPDCQEEYDAPAGRRKYAQTICCNSCGPEIRVEWLHEGQFVLQNDRVAYDNLGKREQEGTIQVGRDPSWEDALCRDEVALNNLGKREQEGSIQVGRDPSWEGVLCRDEVAFKEVGKREEGGTIQTGRAPLREGSPCRMGGALRELQQLKKATSYIQSNLNTIVALKDVGGYHLACSPWSSEALTSLRQMKGRENKPFAVMFPSMELIREYCEVNEKEEELLTSSARPIVLLKTKKTFDKQVCNNSPYMGAFLPSNPLQLIFIKELGPFVMTSANFSGGLMITDNDDMKSWLTKAAVGIDSKICIISHNRDILVPLDDSINRVIAGRVITVRRSRGYVPNPVPVNLTGSYFAAGGDLKATFAYIQNGRAYLSTQFGDLDNPVISEVYNREKVRMKQLFKISDETNVCDLHPLYNSAKSLRNESNPPVEVLHHMAHAASVICEHDLKGEVIGVAFDGTGYGNDGSIWGSEFFRFDIGESTSVKRIAHLKPVNLAGSDAAAKDATLSMYGYLASFEDDLEAGCYDKDKLNITRAAAKMNINRVMSTSMGRLFDAVAAFLGVCSYNGYEGEAPCELEYIARQGKAYKLSAISPDGDTALLFKSMAKALMEEVPVCDIAYGFHMAVADFVVDTVKATGVKQVALSGGTFLNAILLEKVIDDLEKSGHLVYVNNAYPVSDAGICIGQAFLAERKVICV